MEEIRGKLDDSEDGPDKKERPKENDMYRQAMTRSWKRLGYPEGLAQLRTELVYTDEQSELEWLAEQIRAFQINKNKRAEVLKLVGDVRRKQGRTEQAFKSYLKALKYAKDRSYVKTELARIILTDLYRGGRKASAYAMGGDASEFLDSWLGKYGTLEDIRGIVELVSR